MAERETSRDIDQAASDWTARLDRGPLAPEELGVFEAWLNGDPRRKGALLRAQAVAMKSEAARALGPDFDPALFGTQGPVQAGLLSRRRAMVWAGGGAVAAAAVAFGVGVTSAGAVTSTERGEIRLAPLKDGSTVLLNTDSRIRVRYEASERVVTLLSGEAYFSVARDERRPFVVEVNGRRLRATQAGFRVRRLDAHPVDILVQWGRVDVAPGLLVRGRAVALAANTQLTLTGGELPRPIAPGAVTRDLAWREGKLAFEGETLAQAVDAFARYSDTRIQVRDASLAREPVTGLFAANDPVGFGRAIARVFDARLEQRGEEVVLTRGSAGSNQ